MADAPKTIWPKTPGQEPARLYTVEPVAQMDDIAGMQAFVAGSIPFPEETITRARRMLGGVESHLDEAIEGGPFWEDYDVTPQAPTPEAIEAGRELMDRLVPVPSPWVLTKTGLVQDLTDEDLAGFDFGTDESTDLRAFIDNLSAEEETPNA